MFSYDLYSEILNWKVGIDTESFHNYFWFDSEKKNKIASTDMFALFVWSSVPQPNLQHSIPFLLRVLDTPLPIYKSQFVV